MSPLVNGKFLRGRGTRKSLSLLRPADSLAWQRPVFFSARRAGANKIVRETATRNPAFKEIQVGVSQEGER